MRNLVRRVEQHKGIDVYLSKTNRKYIVFAEDSISEALVKISDNKSRLAFVVSEHGGLLGSVTDGDIRRWLISSGGIDLSLPISIVMNPNCKKIRVGDASKDLKQYFVNGIDCLPVVDEADRIVKLVFADHQGFLIGDREVSETTPSFIIAEIGNNHQGDIKLAKELVDHAVGAGVDCAKFQMRNVSALYRNDGDTNDASADLGTQYTMDLLSKFQLSNDELFEVFDYCKEKGVLPLCTPWDLDSLRALEEYGMPAYKVASADFTNYELLAEIAATGKPFLCSTGMSSEVEISKTVQYLDSLGAEYVLLHCNSTYPTPYKDVNLKYLTRLRNITGKLVGYSGHERGIAVPIAAVALGACVIEKHLTLDKSYEGTDHKVSLLPDELREMVRQIRIIEEASGSEIAPREITQGEMINRENLAKSLVATRLVRKGEIITRDMVCIKSPGQGVQPNRLDDLIGKVASRDVEQDGFFYESDIEGGAVKRGDYNFNRPFGVPVRYHDFRKIVADTNLDFVEFHLSYKDLDLDLEDYFAGVEDIGFAVHSPELFAGDHILDLCSDNPEHRARSIQELQRVVEVTRELKQYFPKTEQPVIVVNAGGWNEKGFIATDVKDKKYRLISEALQQIDSLGVVIAIQTMPPFPWHFGGQSFHNLFVDADEIVKFCSDNPDVKVCLDVSHSMMASNYYGWDLIEFVSKIAPYNVHMHIVDALGVDGEGVEIGRGDVDFRALSQLLNSKCPRIQFIPEVWQGHKNSGEGFWAALDFLEGVFSGT